MPTYTESDLAAALLAIRNGASLKSTAKRFAIPRTTLQNRLRGTRSHQAGAGHLQRLPPPKEALLVQWILVEHALGLPPTQLQIRGYVERVLRAGGDHAPLGSDWIRGFLRRNPEVKAIWAKKRKTGEGAEGEEAEAEEEEEEEGEGAEGKGGEGTQADSKKSESSTVSVKEPTAEKGSTS